MWIRLLAIALALAPVAASAAVKLDIFARGFANPTQVVHAPGDDDRLYIVEQRGTIQRLHLKGGNREPFLDLSDHVVSGGEAGMHSIAFHPKFTDNGRFYVAYTGNFPTFGQVLSEFKGVRTGEKILMVVAKRARNHNGGQLMFGPDRFLYFSTGDGGGAGDPEGNAQNPNSLLGKILRLDIDAGPATGPTPYATPSSNPYAGGGGKKEVYALGLRNVWRFSFDRKTGDLWAGDVGQDKVEEIDVIRRGGNYGWNVFEGDMCFQPPTGCKPALFDKPVFSYGRSEGTSITGGFVYRGMKIPELYGKYIYADYGSGNIWALTPNAARSETLKNELIASRRGAITSFGEAPDGELYVVLQDGSIGRLAAGP